MIKPKICYVIIIVIQFLFAGPVVKKINADNSNSKPNPAVQSEVKQKEKVTEKLSAQIKKDVADKLLPNGQENTKKISDSLDTQKQEKAQQDTLSNTDYNLESIIQSKLKLIYFSFVINMWLELRIRCNPFRVYFLS